MLGLRAKHLPLPPVEMRQLTGLTDASWFEPPIDWHVSQHVRQRTQYESVLDFGCGCGRNARQLALSRVPVKLYVGIDLHAGMIRWAQQNITPRAPRFTFAHQNVYNPGFNPDPALPRTMPFPVEDRSVTLLIAHSVFTHLLESQIGFYLGEARRVLRDDGIMLATFFLFEKRYFPMMQDFQNALYINPDDPTNAVIVDRNWLLDEVQHRSLGVADFTVPHARGFQWTLEIRPGQESVALPADTAPFGRHPPPVSEGSADTIGASADSGT